MSLWEGANVASKSRHGASSASSSSIVHRSGETIEAALHRLRKTYAAAMECVAAWHSVNNNNDQVVWKHVGHAARSTFDQGLLLDAMVQYFAPTYTVERKKMTMMMTMNDGTTSSTTTTLLSSPSPLLTSATHFETVQTLTYLSLVNVADLLVAGCCCEQTTLVTVGVGNTTNNCNPTRTLLDRGVVVPSAVRTNTMITLTEDEESSTSLTTTTNNNNNNSCCCWENEAPEQTLRLALVALLDASCLDGSDPILWLKMACVARRLGRLLDDHPTLADTPAVFLKFRRLEQYALEKGLTTLPPHVPPSRLLVQAMEEWKREDETLVDYEYTSSIGDSSQSSTTRDDAPLHVVMSRYSWPTLARTLLRVVRGEGGSGGAAGNHHHNQHHHQHHHIPPTTSALCSTVILELAPMLVLPTVCIGQVCAFLTANEQHALEATCRALSYSVVSARATRDYQNQIMVVQDNNSNNGNTRAADLSTLAPATSDDLQQQRQPSHQTQDSEPDSREADSTSMDHGSPSHRVSKRLRTQILTEGKKEKRLQRRQSVEYCVSAVTLGCAPDSLVYKELVATKRFDWNSVLPMDQMLQTLQQTGGGGGVGGSLLNRSSSFADNEIRVREDARRRLGDSSLSGFVHAVTWDISPLGLLFRFVAHVGMHVEDVFASDKASPMMLCSSLLDCIDMLLRRSQVQHAFVPSWSSGELSAPGDARLKKMEWFAIDLLHAELLLKRAERLETLSSAFDSDGNRVSLLVPSLLRSMDELEHCLQTAKTKAAPAAMDRFVCLQARCNWLATSYYLWRSRLSQNVSESKEAEQEGFRYLEETSRCLKGAVSDVQTPHLDSAQRKGQHWKTLREVSLSAFRDEIQAASVILSTRERFLDEISKLDDSGDDFQLEKVALVDIGETLLERYEGTPEAVDAKLLEIVDDFVSTHGDALSRKTENGLESDLVQEWFGSVVPTAEVDLAFLRGLSTNSSVSLLSILSTCLVAGEQFVPLLELYGRLIVVICLSLSSSSVSKPSSSDETQMIDSDDDSSADDDDDTGNARLKSGFRQHAVLLRLLLRKIQLVLMDERHTSLSSIFRACEICCTMTQLSLKVCSEWFTYPPPKGCDLDFDDKEDLGIFQCIVRLIETLRKGGKVSTFLLSAFVLGVANVITKQSSEMRSILDTKQGRDGRFVRQRLVKVRTEIIASACCVLSDELTSHLINCKSTERAIIRTSSTLIHDIKPEVCDTLLWLWKTAQGNEMHSKERLLVPVATAIVAVCGASVASFECASRLAGDSVSLADFFDSDASVTACISNTDEDTEEETKDRLRVLGQTVHAVNGVFSIVDEESATAFKFSDNYTTKDGPMLPLVVSRVLCFVAEDLVLAPSPRLDGFESKKNTFWEDYPYGTRTIGALLDTLLFKAYKCLHGFVLTNSNESKDAAAPSNSTLKTQRYNPENLGAAVSLYRCIMRAYSQGRKSPPKAALDTVLNALPPISSGRDGRTDSLKEFLFTSSSPLSTKDVEAVASQDANWKLYFQSLDFDDALSREEEEDEVIVVRKGISRLLAQGALPEQGSEYDRNESVAAEEELSKKFHAVLDDLCLGDPSDCEGWYKAAQCMIAKSDLIADRIGLSQGFSRSSNFTVPQRPSMAETSLSLAELIEHQERECRLKEEGWVGSLGNDLSVYVRHSWSSFSSLQDCSAELGRYLSKEGPNNYQEDLQFHQRVYDEITGLLGTQDYTRWQQAWGGIFVSSLRLIAVRCLCMALFFLFREGDDDHTEDTKRLVADIFELLAVGMYSEASCSQVYGYPMQQMSSARKRDGVSAALTFFTKAIATLQDVDKQEPIWELRFMQGKCHEKMASTLKRESFLLREVEGEESRTRRYEFYMTKALQAYSDSFSEATSLEKTGELHADQKNGGSCHGPIEAFYRLHATRLKCLIYAVDCREDEREMAEMEALRLTEMHWYHEPGEPLTVSSMRDRVWTVLTDVVDGLVKCRLDHCFFHRSVYRHAQALLWAPVLEDPVGQRAAGSMGTVSATRAFKIRGLNSTNAASSAATVMNVLFEKKRSQMCAVWMTAGTGSPFNLINQTIRKYDSLRGKYISAYLDTLRICQQRDHLESFLKSIYAARRDLPSYFAASAETQGNPPQSPHSDDSLLTKSRSVASHFFLTTVKRQANGSLAAVILHESQSSKSLTNSAKENNLKAAYSCFLRLNCTSDALMKSIRSWRYQRKCDAIRSVVECLTDAYLKQIGGPSGIQQSGDWSGESQQASTIRSAIEFCRKSYPSLSGNYIAKKPTQKKKRKDPETTMVKKSFDVHVPEGSKAGDTFVVSIDVNGGNQKKVRLTIPDPVPNVMRFSLLVPALEDEKDAKKSKLP